jgi:parallel beta-helix repeat protein
MEFSRSQLHSLRRTAALPLAMAALATAPAAAHAAAPAPIPASTGTTYYVSPSGSDSSAGTLSAPWKTVTKALTARPGSRVLVRAGTYSEKITSSVDGTASQPISVENYPGERPVFSVKVTLNDASNVRFRGMLWDGAKVFSTAIRISGGSNIEFSNNEIRNYRGGGDSTAQAFLIGNGVVSNLQIIGNRVHDNGVWNEHDHGVYCKSASKAYIANNLFYNLNRGFGIQLYNGDGGTGCDDSMIVNNTFDNVQESGITVSRAADRNLIENNVVTNNTATGASDYGYAVTQGSGAGSGNVVRNNLGFGNRQSSEFRCSVCAMSNNLHADPKYLSRSAGDFRLQAGSGALTRGLLANAPKVDFAGAQRPQGAGLDVGAHEYVEGPTTTEPAPDPTPTPEPDPTPTPEPTAGFEAETMTAKTIDPVDRKLWPQLLSESSASAGKAFNYGPNSTATKSVATDRVVKVTVRARGAQCNGAPTAKVRIDGTQVASFTVSSTTYADYSQAIDVPAGSHSVGVSFDNNYYESGVCNRNLYVDRVTLSRGDDGTAASTGATAAGYDLKVF